MRPRIRTWRAAFLAASRPYLSLLLAIAITAIALLLALAAATSFNDAPVPIFLAAVLVSSWLRGLWPGLVTTALSTLALVRFFDLSRGAPLPSPEDTAFDLALFIVVAVLINWLTARLRLAVRRLQLARAEAEAANRARDEFVAAAAHDLKSPLAGISMAAELAQHRIARAPLDAPTLKTVVSSLQDVERDAFRISDLLDDLLDVVHLQAGRPLPLRLARTRLLDLVGPVAAAYRVGSQSHEIAVVHLGDPVGMWDARRLTRVLDNLLSNATKYSPRGGQISVTVREDRSPDGRRTASVRVCDCGVGIPAADMGQIFERFFRARNVGRIAGSGIGLAGARAIVEQHGGSLKVESREGAGSTFILQLPMDA